MSKYFYFMLFGLVACNNVQNQNNDKVTDLITKAAQGDTKSQFELALKSKDVNPVEAVHWFNVILFSNPSDKNYLSEAEYNLSLIFEATEVHEIEQDTEKSMALLKNSAFHGSKDAQYKLGLLDYQSNRKNLSEAVGFLTSSALQGHSYAQLLLGVIYSNGERNILKNKELSFRFIQLSAQQKNPGALILLSSMYYKGNEFVQKDKNKAIQLSQMAVDNDNDGKFKAVATETLKEMKEDQLKDLSIDLNEGMLM